MTGWRGDSGISTLIDKPRDKNINAISSMIRSVPLAPDRRLRREDPRGDILVIYLRFESVTIFSTRRQTGLFNIHEKTEVVLVQMTEGMSRSRLLKRSAPGEVGDESWPDKRARRQVFRAFESWEIEAPRSEAGSRSRNSFEFQRCRARARARRLAADRSAYRARRSIFTGIDIAKRPPLNYSRKTVTATLKPENQRGVSETTCAARERKRVTTAWTIIHVLFPSRNADDRRKGRKDTQ